MSRHARYDRLEASAGQLSTRRLLAGLVVFLVGLALWVTGSRELRGTVAALGCVLVVDHVATGAHLWLVAGGLCVIAVHLIAGRSPSLDALSATARLLGVVAVLVHLHHLLQVRR